MLAKPVRKSKGKITPISEGAKLVDQYFDHVGEAFLRHCPEIETAKLKEWRPKLFSFTRLNPWYGGLMGVHRKSIGLGKDKIVWLEMGSESSPVLLLMHGFAAAKEHWIPMIPFLAGQFRILIPDLPGWGESGFNPEQHYGLEDQTQRLHGWLTEIGVHRVNVVGNSMGGALAGLMAARFPEMVTCLVLMDALGLPGTEETDFIREVLRGKNRLVPRAPMEVMKLTELVFHNRALAASAAFFSVSELVHRKDVNGFLFQEMLSRRPDYTKATFEDITAPTLVMWGKQDDVLHISCAYEFERLIKRAEMCLFDDVGHLPMIESPYPCAQAIKEFVLRNI